MIALAILNDELIQRRKYIYITTTRVVVELARDVHREMEDASMIKLIKATIGVFIPVATTTDTSEQKRAQ
jgi:hypothetical protein